MFIDVMEKLKKVVLFVESQEIVKKWGLVLMFLETDDLKNKQFLKSKDIWRETVLESGNISVLTALTDENIL